jgi:hypothetical protein
MTITAYDAHLVAQEIFLAYEERDFMDRRGYRSTELELFNAAIATNDKEIVLRFYENQTKSIKHDILSVDFLTSHISCLHACSVFVPYTVGGMFDFLIDLQRNELSKPCFERDERGYFPWSDNYTEYYGTVFGRIGKRSIGEFIDGYVICRTTYASMQYVSTW